jgi:hypothetical protein
MLSVFTLRLAAGMIACLLLLAPSQINPRYFRTHFLIAFALTGVAWVFWRRDISWSLLFLFVAAMVVAFLGSVSFALENAPGGRVLIVLETVLLAAVLGTLDRALAPTSVGAFALVGDTASALYLGATMSAMLMGHLYLIAPTMSLKPLFRLLAAAGVALLLRMVVDGVALACWTETNSFSKVGNETLLWLPVRWLVGFVAPLILGWMAWQSARIRSTQSATGILYVVVIMCFLGELTSLLLRDMPGSSITL